MPANQIPTVKCACGHFDWEHNPGCEYYDGISACNCTSFRPAPSPSAAPAETTIATGEPWTFDRAIAELEAIFADLQKPDRFHDQWDWFEASVALDVLKSYAPSTPRAAEQVAETGADEAEELCRKIHAFLREGAGDIPDLDVTDEDRERARQAMRLIWDGNISTVTEPGAQIRDLHRRLESAYGVLHCRERQLSALRSTAVPDAERVSDELVALKLKLLRTDAIADEIERCVLAGRLDSRSKLADLCLNYRHPFSADSVADRLAKAEAELLALRSQTQIPEVKLTKDDVWPFMPEGDDYFTTKVRSILLTKTESECRALFQAVLKAARAKVGPSPTEEAR